MKFKPKIFIVVDWDHFFYEFFEPLIQSFGESLDITVVINDLDPEHTSLIIERCNNLKNVNNMSVIQRIRDKYIGLVIGAIVIALIGFLVMDAMQSNVIQLRHLPQICSFSF